MISSPLCATPAAKTASSALSSNSPATRGRSSPSSIRCSRTAASSSDPRVKDVDVESPLPGQVLVTVLSTEGDGTASSELLGIVEYALNAEDIRPITDQVILQTASIIHYTIEADLYFYKGPDPETVLGLSRTSIENYVTVHHLLGHDIPLSGLYAALHRDGVQRVVLKQPVENIVLDRQSAAFCQNILLTNRGIDE